MYERTGATYVDPTATHTHTGDNNSNFLRLGREGYREIMMNAMQNAKFLREALEDTGKVSAWV